MITSVSNSVRIVSGCLYIPVSPQHQDIQMLYCNLKKVLSIKCTLLLGCMWMQQLGTLALLLEGWEQFKPFVLHHHSNELQSGHCERSLPRCQHNHVWHTCTHSSQDCEFTFHLPSQAEHSSSEVVPCSTFLQLNRFLFSSALLWMLESVSVSDPLLLLSTCNLAP